MDITVNLEKIDYAVIAIYIAGILSLGFWVSFRKGHTTDLFLAGRSLGWVNIGLSMWATNTTPSSFIATAGAAYATGLITSNFALLTWPFLLLMSMVFVPHYLSTRISTMPEFMSRRYDESCRNFLSWYTIISALVVWLGVTLYAGGILLQQVFGWPFWVCVAVLAAVGTSFTVAGGLAAVVITDSFQCILMVAASAVLTFMALDKVGGISNLIEKVPADYWDIFQSGEGCEYPWYAFLLGYPVLGVWFWSTDQTIIQRALGARDIRQAQLGGFLVGATKLVDPMVFWIPGILCLVLHPNLAEPDHAYVTMVTTYLPTGMVGLIVAVLIAAVISTVDSGLNSLSTVFSLDIYRKYFRPEASQRLVTAVGRITTVTAGVISAVLAMAMTAARANLFDLLQSVISFMAPPMAAVFLIGVLWKRANAKAAFWTLVVGLALSTCIGVIYLYVRDPDTWPAYLHYLLLAFYLFVGLSVLMVVVSLLTAPPPPEKALPSLRLTYRTQIRGAKLTWILWAVLAAVMTAVYIVLG